MSFARLAAAAALALAFPRLSAAPTGFADSLVPDPGFAALGALPEPLDGPSLERAALLASGLRPGELGPYQDRLEALVDRVAAEAAAGPDAAARAEAVLTALHRSALKAYREDATTLDGILDTGLYNCVSSAVLYMIAARRLGIPVEGVRTSDHAFCEVRVGGRSVDVETTNPYGFDPGGKKEFKDSFGRVTGYAYVAPGGYGDRRSVEDRQLAGLILSNRASALELSRRFAEAARLGADYAALCPGPDSRAFLVDRVNNLVADLGTRRDFAGARDAARAAASALPGEARLSALAATASYNFAVSIARAGDWEAAFDAAVGLASAPPGSAAFPEAAEARSLVASSLASLAQGYADRGDFAGARAAVAARAERAGPAATAAALALVGDMELARAVNGLPFAQAQAAADRLLASGEASVGRYAQAIAAIYGNEANRMGSAGDWLGAAALAERGIAKLAGARAPDDGSLARGAAAFRRNFVAQSHNLFARLYNSGDYKGAEAKARAALAVMPGDPILARDLAAAQAALAR